MMLHEAVMLEIYRQALNASELASPRCLSRESNTSGGPHDGRCPSNDSHCSGNDSNHTETHSAASVGLPLPASLGPAAAAAAAALLPSPQSAAVAAYLNAAAAAAAQQNHLLLGNPLASLVQQAQQHAQQPGSPHDDAAEANILDFSTKRRIDSANGSEAGDDHDDSNLESKSSQGERASGDEQTRADHRQTPDEANNSPLDLSVGAGRKRATAAGDVDDEEQQLAADHEDRAPSRKLLRPNDYKTATALPPGTWVPPINPYLAAVAAASFSPNTPGLDCWSGSKQKISPNEATKALEKMTEMTRLGSATHADTSLPHGTSASGARTSASSTTSSASSSAGSGAAGGGRHSAWQSHWLNKGADAAKDVFKCVWCKQSFPTLATLTTHMKETQHCGVNVPATATNTAANAPPSATTPASQSSGHVGRSAANMASSTGGPSNAAATSAASTSNKSDLNLLIKETMPLPRKLVRGQDVWLGKGAEQTRQILKCMWCGQSFRSLAEMTSHMQETQHYTNIISQEQIISWKSSEDKDKASTPTPTNSPPSTGASQGPTPTPSTTANATVAAVLTCKACDQAFASLKDLSNHMAKHNHYKEASASVGSLPARPSAESPQLTRRGRQSREKRKKSLPVRKLLELERAQQDFKMGHNNNGLDPALKPLRDFAASTKITCEKCGDKIETALFVDHIRQCLGGSIPIPPRNHNNNNNNNMKSSYMDRLTSPQTAFTSRDGRKPADDDAPLYKDHKHVASSSSSSSTSSSSSSTPSVLNALEQLIEKSFDTRSRQSGVFGGGGATQPNTPLGASILKRLGIDDSVDYTKPLMDPQTMHFLRTYSGYGGGGVAGGAGGAGRDRSASESSSVSERCSSRLEAMTPERQSEVSRQATPRLTPDKTDTCSVKIKTEPGTDPSQDMGAEDLSKAKISVKKEFTMPDDVERPLAVKEEKDGSDFERDLRAGVAASRSPAMSTAADKKSTGGSLNALSSMFDNLGSSKMSSHGTNPETNNNNTHASTTSKKSNANPLAALQKLCDTTDPPSSNTRSTSNHGGTPTTSQLSSASSNGSVTGPGSMVAFSWACNDAVMTSADSIIKCSFCDTPFCSKGAYRHHLSKVHFVKDEATPHEGAATQAIKSPAAQSLSPKSPKTPAKSPAAQRHCAPSPAAGASPSASPSAGSASINPFNESPQSKFLKYTELAKQLSSKNA